MNKILLINPSANVFVFGDFKVHHKDWITYSGGTDKSDELLQFFLNDLTQMVTFPFWIPSQSCSFDLLISSDASICFTMAFPPLGNSGHVEVSVSIDFPS